MYDITIQRGITYGPLQLVCKAGGEPVDLTGYTVEAKVAKLPGRVNVFDLEPEITDAAGGEIEIAMTDDETSMLPRGTFGWDLVLVSPEGERLGPIISGALTVSDIYTQPEGE